VSTRLVFSIPPRAVTPRLIIYRKIAGDAALEKRLAPLLDFAERCNSRTRTSTGRRATHCTPPRHAVRRPHARRLSPTVAYRDRAQAVSSSTAIAATAMAG
jgi:hypothetical protein